MPPQSSDTIRQLASGSWAHVIHLPGRLDTPATSERPLPSTPTDAERAFILRICLRATRDRDDAEDLAQETLLEAWRHWDKLREPDDPQARARWLSAIAANVCRRWLRRAGRDLARTTRLTLTGEGADIGDTMDPLADKGDALDAELEHAERAQLLDRALGLLPPETRAALIARYLLELPLDEIAARHRLSEATLSVRLHRGKQALRQALATTLREEALAYGLLPMSAEGWRETSIWCPQCGERRLLGQLGGFPTRLRLRCPRCAHSRSGNVDQDDFIDHISYRGILDGIQTFKAALNRVGMWTDSYYRPGAVARQALCPCGRIVPFTLMRLGEIALTRRGEYGLRANCPCRAQNHADIAGMALSTTEARGFWRAHPRIHRLPNREIETGGRQVIVVRYAAVSGGAQLDTLFAHDSYELLRIHQTPGA